MRLIKLGVISILILFLLVTGIGLLFPSVAKVSRAIDINAPVDSVYKVLSDFRYWPLWMDGLNNQTPELLTGTTTGRNATVKFGNNTISFEELDSNSIKTVWIGTNRNKQEGNFRLISNPQKTLTTVNWYFIEQLNWYPWERFASMMNDNILGPTMEKSLENLKQLSEGRTVNPANQ